MRRTAARNLLVGTVLFLVFAAPAVLGPTHTSAVSAGPQPERSELRAITGAIQRMGVAGPDRPTRATVAEALLPEWTAPDAVLPAQPVSHPAAQPVWQPAPASPAPPGVVAPPAAVGGAAGQEFSLINQDRASSGARALAWSATLARVAQYRAQDMLNRNYFSHYDPATGELAFAELLHAWGVPYSFAGENIAWSTDPSMAAINTMFMNSPEHRDNILNSGYGRVGVGVVSNGAKVVVVEVFSN